MKLINMIGLKFGRLIVIQRDNKLFNKPHYICQCECGKIKSIDGTSLRRKMTMSCGCLELELKKNRNQNNHSHWKGYEEISGNFLYNIKRGACKRKLEYNLSNKYIWDLFIRQNRKCNLSGLELTFDSRIRRRKDITASLDRIDSSKGYIEGNVQWIHKDINMMKNNHNEKYFIGLCHKISHHYESNK